MRRMIFMVLFIPVLMIVGSCSRNKTKHPRGPAEFGELVENATTLKLKLPDTLNCNENMHVRIDGKGHLYAELFPNYLVGVFDSVGQMIKVIGQQGFGAGEFTKILDFRVTEDGQIYIMDALTEKLSVFDLDRGLLFTIPSIASPTMTFDVFQGRILFFRRAVEGKIDPHVIIIKIRPDGTTSNGRESFLNSEDESIRTHYLASQALATNSEGVSIFGFMAAKVIYLLSTDHKLSEIDLDETTYKISRTEDLQRKYQDDKAKGLLGEVFKNSRIMSLGFVSPEHILLSFATDRLEKVKFYSQLYCISTGEPFSIAYETKSPVFYVGNYTFATWNKSRDDGKRKSGKTDEITLFKFRSKH